MLSSNNIRHKGHHRYLALNNMAERFIPTDILFNFLARIPALTLQRLKHVCKEWLQIISDPDFAEAHFAYQSRKIYGWGIFLNTNQGIYLMEGTSECIPTWPKRMNLPGAHGETLVHDSCKGFVLYSSVGEDFKLHIGNPITGESLTFPPFRGYNKPPISANIGSCGREIKLVVVVRQIKHTLTTPYVCGIFTLGTNSWREMLSPIAGDRLQKKAVFTRGALHWSYDTGVLSLELSQEKFHQTEATICSSVGPQKCVLPVEWDGCYAVVFPQEHLPPSPFYRIWILRESEWTKQPDIGVEFFESVGYYARIKRPHFCTTMRNGEVLVFYQPSRDTARILVYDLSRQELTWFTQFYADFLDGGQPKGRLSLVPHVNSLISFSSTPSPFKRSGICGKGAMMSTLVSNFTHCACIMRNLLSYCKSHVWSSSYLRKILMVGRKLVNDCSSTQVEVYRERRGQDEPQWCAPDKGFVKLSADIALTVNEKCSCILACGIVIRDCEGMPICISAAILPRWSSFIEAAAEATLHGIKLCLQLCIRKVILEVNDSEVIALLSRRTEQSSCSIIQEKIMESRVLLELFDSFEARDVERGCSQAAHRTAAYALDCNESFTLFHPPLHSIPSPIKEIISKEKICP